MRTRVNDLGLGLKKLALMFIVAAAFVGCGQNNTSGKSKDSCNPSYEICNSGGTVISGGNGQTLPGNWKSVVLNENRCQYGRMSAITGASGVNASAGVYVGVTMEGDVAIISGNVMELHFCKRPDANQPNGGVTQKAVVNNSQYCSVGEISALDVALQGNYGTYNLAFFPLQYKGSTLCQGGGYQQYPY